MISTVIFYFQCKLIHVKVISCAFQIMAGSPPRRNRPVNIIRSVCYINQLHFILVSQPHWQFWSCPCIVDTALSEVLVFKLLRTEIAADPDGAGWTLSFLHCTSGPRFTSSASRGRTVALFCLAEGLSYDIIAVLPELLVGINDCAPCLPMPIPNSFWRRSSLPCCSRLVSAKAPRWLYCISFSAGRSE